MRRVTENLLLFSREKIKPVNQSGTSRPMMKVESAQLPEAPARKTKLRPELM